MTAWGKEKFSKDREVATNLLGELDLIQSNNVINDIREFEINAQLSAILSCEEKFWKQRSYVCWLKEGDSNTRFVHLTAKQQKCRNKITRIVFKGYNLSYPII